MARKRWSAKTDITPTLLKSREKRKWQIALRRYVLEKNPSPFYAPYFGLDIEKLRKWFQVQFEKSVDWVDFGKKWQFGHIIPVTYFDFSSEADLKMCWNFTNIRVEQFQQSKEEGNLFNLSAARGYFEDLHKKTNYPPCLQMLEKIAKIEISEIVQSERQQTFILENRDHLIALESYSGFEFELLNSGRDIDDVKREIEFLKKFEK